MNLCDVHFLGNQCISAKQDAGLKYQFHKPIGKKELFSRTARLMTEKKKVVCFGSRIPFKILLKINQQCSEEYRKISTDDKFSLPIMCNTSTVWPFNICPIDKVDQESLVSIKVGFFTIQVRTYMQVARPRSES